MLSHTVAQKLYEKSLKKIKKILIVLKLCQNKLDFLNGFSTLCHTIAIRLETSSAKVDGKLQRIQTGLIHLIRLIRVRLQFVIGTD